MADKHGPNLQAFSVRQFAEQGAPYSMDMIVVPEKRCIGVSKTRSSVQSQYPSLQKRAIEVQKVILSIVKKKYRQPRLIISLRSLSITCAYRSMQVCDVSENSTSNKSVRHIEAVSLDKKRCQEGQWRSPCLSGDRGGRRYRETQKRT